MKDLALFMGPEGQIDSDQRFDFPGKSSAGLCHDFRPLPSRSIAYSQILTRFLGSQAIEYEGLF